MQTFNFEPQFNAQFPYAPNFHFTFPPESQNSFLNFNPFYTNNNEAAIPLQEMTPAKASSLQSTSKKIAKSSPLSPEKTPNGKARAARNLWKPHEDEMLLRLVAEHGPKWTLIGKMIGGRVCKQVRDRYLNNLRPNINSGPFTREEDEQLAFLYQQMGPKWRKIADSMPGRTESQVKNRFYMCLKDRLHHYKVSPLAVKKNDSASSQSTIDSEACPSEAISPDFNALNRKESLDFGFISYNRENTKQVEDDNESLDCHLNFGRGPSYRLEGL